MKKTFKSLFVLSMVGLVTGVSAAVVSSDNYNIVIPEQASASEQTAATELSRCLERITGEQIPVVRERLHDPAHHGIYIGKSDFAQKSGKVDFEKLGSDGIHLLSLGDDLILAGNRRGTLYAVYEFLERYADCRWFAEGCIVIPAKKDFEIPEVDFSYIPVLEYRGTDYKCIYSDPHLIVANRLNDAYARGIGEEWGGSYYYDGFVHTLLSFVPTEVYGKSHPEYFSEIDGKRMTEGHTQLCLTNPEVLEIVTEEVKRRFRNSPDAIVSLSQMDWYNYCCCENCTALAEKEGSQSGPMIHFVNAVARAVRDEFPDRIVDTLAYLYTRKPPKFVKTEPNVVVRLCSIECCFAHTLEEDEFNASFEEDLKAWAKCCSRLHIWDYIINYAHTEAPFPNFRVLAPNIRFFSKHSVTGIYEEANYFCRGGEFEQLRAYLTARCLWNPDYDVEKGIVEFTDAYYGVAASKIREYINLIHDHVSENLDTHMTIYTHPSDYMTKEVMDQALACLQEAAKAVEDQPEFLSRVESAMLPVYYIRILCRMDEGEVRSAMLDHFEAIASKTPDLKLAESAGGNFTQFVEEQRKIQ